MSFSPPDWREALAYPSPETQPDLAFWAWQFLRRNPGYQAEWTSYVASLAEMVVRVPELGHFVKAHCSPQSDSSSDDAKVRNEFLDIKVLGLLLNQPEFHVIDSSLEEDGRRWSRNKEFVLGDRWGIDRLQHPGMDTLRSPNRFLCDGGHACFVGYDRSNVDDANYALLKFDLRLPVDALRSQFETLLQERARRIEKGYLVCYEGRPQRALANYGSYLRVLDAITAQAKVSDIATVLLPHQDAEGAKKVIRNWSIAATKIRDDTYRTLPASVNR